MTFVLCNNKIALGYYTMLNHRSEVSFKNLNIHWKSRDTTKSRNIFDRELPISLDSYTHFLYGSLDIGGSYAFPKMSNPQGSRVLPHKIDIL